LHDLPGRNRAVEYRRAWGRPDSNRNWSCRTRPALATATTHLPGTARATAASVKPVCFSARPQQRALGSPRAGCRGQVSDMDQRQSGFARWSIRACAKTRIRLRYAVLYTFSYGWTPLSL